MEMSGHVLGVLKEEPTRFCHWLGGFSI